MLKVKVFDEEHEKDLEDRLNNFLETLNEKHVKDIQFQVCVTNVDEENQVFCFSAMVVYFKSNA